MRASKYIFWLLVIVALAFVLRVYKLTDVPPSLNWDEVSIGYNAYSILKTGRDEWGRFLPIHFESYGEYKLPGQIYASIPAIMIFGLNPFGVRITPVIYGTLTIVFLYLLVLEMFSYHPQRKKHAIALISSFLLAVSPWHIQLTRASFESSFALMWVTLGIWFLIRGFKKPKWWFFAVFPFVFAMYTYNSARLFIPLFIITFGVFYFKLVKKYTRIIILSGILFTALLIPTITFFLNGEGTARYRLVSITDDPGLIPRIEERRNKSTLPPLVTNLIHNRVTYVSFYIGKNYLAHFTPDYLFIDGAFHKQHHPQEIGELYWIQFPFLVLGLYFLFKKKEKYSWLLIIWLLIAIFPASITNDIIPHALRTLNAAPGYQIITAYGFVIGIVSLKKKRLLLFKLTLTASVLLFTFQFIKYQIYFYTKYPNLYSRDWQYGNKQVVEYIKVHYHQYDLIVYTREYGEPHMFTLFYLSYPPENYQNNEDLVRFETYNWVRVLSFDKFYFPDLGDEGTKISDIIAAHPDQRILFIATPDEITNGTKVLQKISFLDGNTAFVIVEN